MAQINFPCSCDYSISNRKPGRVPELVLDTRPLLLLKANRKPGRVSESEILGLGTRPESNATENVVTAT